MCPDAGHVGVVEFQPFLNDVFRFGWMGVEILFCLEQRTQESRDPCRGLGDPTIPADEHRVQRLAPLCFPALGVPAEALLDHSEIRRSRQDGIDAVAGNGFGGLGNVHIDERDLSGGQAVLFQKSREIEFRYRLCDHADRFPLESRNTGNAAISTRDEIEIVCPVDARDGA